MQPNEHQEYSIKVMLDDITFMLYDLERGGFIQQEGIFEIGTMWQIDYKRVLIEESEQNGLITTISDFFVCVRSMGTSAPVGEPYTFVPCNEIVKFETRGALRKFTLFSIEGFQTDLFVTDLEKFRKEKFSINN